MKITTIMENKQLLWKNSILILFLQNFKRIFKLISRTFNYVIYGIKKKKIKTFLAITVIKVTKIILSYSYQIVFV